MKKESLNTVARHDIQRPATRRTSTSNVENQKPEKEKQEQQKDKNEPFQRKRPSERVLHDNNSVTAVHPPTGRSRTTAVVAEPVCQVTTINREQVETRKKVKVERQEPPWDDLDADDASDPLMASEYVVEIFEYLQEIELDAMPQPDYMDRQKNLVWKMREILVDWMIEVHAKFRLLPETLFLAVNIVDRFFSNRIVDVDKVQLVGTTAMFIAAKYEEVMAPSIQNFMYVTDHGYSDEDILKAERYVLQVLNFDLSFPNPMNFLRRNSKADEYDIQTRTVAKYLMEISLLDHLFLKYRPSQVAAAATFLARRMLERGDWTNNLRHYSGYTKFEIMPVVELMLNYLSAETPRHEAFFKKYAAKKFMKASLFVRDWMKRCSSPIFQEVKETLERGEEGEIQYETSDDDL